MIHRLTRSVACGVAWFAGALVDLLCPNEFDDEETCAERWSARFDRWWPPGALPRKN